MNRAHLSEIQSDGMPADRLPDVREFEVRVLFWGPARDAAGVRELSLLVASGTTIGALRSRLSAKSQALEQLLFQSRISRNLCFVTDDVVVSPGDELAVIPPVSGG